MATMEPVHSASFLPCTAIATLFARQDAVELAWSIVEPALQNPVPTLPCDSGSWGPGAADRLVADVGGWQGSE